MGRFQGFRKLDNGQLLARVLGSCRLPEQLTQVPAVGDDLRQAARSQTSDRLA